MTESTPSRVNPDRHAYLVGAGIGSLAAAVFLVRDGHLAGENVHILEELPVAGGSMDGSGGPDHQWSVRRKSVVFHSSQERG